jgi:hypothetical protein
VSLGFFLPTPFLLADLLKWAGRPGTSLADFFPGFFLASFMNVFPFLLLGFLSRARLASDLPKGGLVFQRRTYGVIGSGIGVVGMSLYVLFDILLSRSSTAAVGYFLLPIFGTLAFVVGYFGGWLLASLVDLGKVGFRPAEKPPQKMDWRPSRLLIWLAAATVGILAVLNLIGWMDNRGTNRHFQEEAFSAETSEHTLDVILDLEEMGENFESQRSPSLFFHFLGPRMPRNVQERILFGLASNPNSSPKLLSRLSVKPLTAVRLRVALHPNTPKEVLKALADDKDAGVRTTASKSLSPK